MKNKIIIIGILLLIPFRLFANPFPKTSYEVLYKNNIRIYPSEVLFVFIDQSVLYDNSIKNKAYQMVGEWIADGRAVEVYSFSSAQPGRYTLRITGGRVDDAPTELFIDNLKRSERELFTVMHSRQRGIARRVVLHAMSQAFNESRDEIYHTDIVRTVKEMSEYIKQYRSDVKNVLMVSDMLENSQITSFYYKKRIRLIDVDKEIMKVSGKNMIGDFGRNVRVYILGLGFYNRTAWRPQSENYLDSDRINNIASFWHKYFISSGSAVIEIGKPMMFGKIH
ncbi:MAG: hypothetical protein HGA59_00865 [Chlorobiaceae bacterium]|jgi:hypothetical protein|nr:hypothetical protein [Chlorobiaceae bacterium]NTV17496.1 hypothetical protein [Chlorobiaceae bacterium]